MGIPHESGAVCSLGDRSDCRFQLGYLKQKSEDLERNQLRMDANQSKMQDMLESFISKYNDDQVKRAYAAGSSKGESRTKHALATGAISVGTSGAMIAFLKVIGIRFGG